MSSDGGFMKLFQSAPWRTADGGGNPEPVGICFLHPSKHRVEGQIRQEGGLPGSALSPGEKERLLVGKSCKIGQN